MDLKEYKALQKRTNKLVSELYEALFIVGSIQRTLDDGACFARIDQAAMDKMKRQYKALNAGEK